MVADGLRSPSACFMKMPPTVKQRAAIEDRKNCTGALWRRPFVRHRHFAAGKNLLKPTDAEGIGVRTRAQNLDPITVPNIDR